MATNQSTLLKTKNTQHNRPSSEPVFDLFVLPHSKVTSTVLLSFRWFMLMKTWLWISRSFFADRSSKSFLILHTGPFLFTQLPVILNYRHLLPTLHHHPLSPCWNTPCIVTCFTHMLFHLPRHPPLMCCLPPQLLVSSTIHHHHLPLPVRGYVWWPGPRDAHDLRCPVPCVEREQADGPEERQWGMDPIMAIS